MIFLMDIVRVHKITYNTQGWRSREVEATRGHSSVLLDRRLNPWTKGRDVGEDCIVLLAASAVGRLFADDPNENVGSSLFYCERSTTVALGQTLEMRECL